MNISINFTKDVFRMLHARLALLNFEKRKSGILATKMSDDVLGWIGLNKATHGHKGFLEINPVIGVRNQQIERFVANFTGAKFDEIIPPTLYGNIGYLMPAEKFRPYVFFEDGPIETVVEKLVNEIHDYGLPFIRDHVDMDALLKGMCGRRFAVRFMVVYRIPVALFLLGRLDAACDFLTTELAKLGNQKDPASLHFKAFAVNLAEHIRTR